jgi:cation transport ATPase
VAKWQLSAAAAATVLSALAGASALPAGAFPEEPVRRDTVKVRLAVRGMSSGYSARMAELVLRRVNGVYDARVSYDSASAEVSYDPGKTSPERFIAELQRMTGLEASVVKDHDQGRHPAARTPRRTDATFSRPLTLSDGIKLAAQTFVRDVVKLSCCAA